MARLRTGWPRSHAVTNGVVSDLCLAKIHLRISMTTLIACVELLQAGKSFQRPPLPPRIAPSAPELEEAWTRRGPRRGARPHCLAREPTQFGRGRAAGTVRNKIGRASCRERV